MLSFIRSQIGNAQMLGAQQIQFVARLITNPRVQAAVAEATIKGQRFVQTPEGQVLTIPLQ